MGNNEPVRKRVADRIRQARQQRELTQAELSSRLADYKISISPTGIAKIESGTRALEISEAAVLTRILGLSLDSLVRDSGLDDSIRESELMEESFTVGMRVVMAFKGIVRDVNDYVRITEERSNLSDPSTGGVSSDDVKEVFECAKALVDDLNDTSFLWRRALATGHTLKREVLEITEDAKGYGGYWEVNPPNLIKGV